MNPYDFVRLDPAAHVLRRPPHTFDHFDGVTGRIEGTIRTLTPFFIPGRQGSSPEQSVTDGRGRTIIPASSLKGMIRSLIETIAPGCWWRTHDLYERALPREYQPCSQGQSLCAACRMFGLIEANGKTHLEGHVRFEDAVCDEPTRCKPMYTPILDGPKLRHKAWYFAGPRQQVTGRKYYFHNENIIETQGLRQSNQGKTLNRYIQPIGVGSVFTLSVQFDNLTPDEWGLLLYALVLEPTMRHKLGYAKPAGLGSIEITLTGITTIDFARRYTADDRGETEYRAESLNHHTYVDELTRRIRSNTQSVTLSDLRRIWAWPPPEGVTYCYPTRAWFDGHGDDPISATLKAPC